MTDKQIIDGVDVSKCKYIDIENFEKPICHCISQRNECEMPCEYNKDCYFKQLARKEQECEELKKELMKKDEVNTFFNTPIEGWSNDPCGICKLKQTLAEIKEIAECCQTPANCKDYCQFYNECIDGGLPLILQKISEVENDNK